MSEAIKPKTAVQIAVQYLYEVACKMGRGDMRHIAEAAQSEMSVLEAMQAQSEPVAWRTETSDGDFIYYDHKPTQYTTEPLYAAPVPAKQEVVAEVCSNCDTELPRGCEGLFYADGAQCGWNAKHPIDGLPVGVKS